MPEMDQIYEEHWGIIQWGQIKKSLSIVWSSVSCEVWIMIVHM